MNLPLRYSLENYHIVIGWIVGNYKVYPAHYQKSLYKSAHVTISIKIYSNKAFVVIKFIL